MRAVDSIRSLLHLASGFSTALLEDMADEPGARTTPETGQHPYWLLGHLVVSEAAVLDQYLLGRPNRHASWAPLFATGTAPDDPADAGPTYAELLDALGGVRASILAYVDTLTDDDLDEPCHPNDWPGPDFDCIGDCLNAVGLHMGIHAGQVACARRAAGRAPLQF